jgi:lysozyme family protein
VGPRRRDVGRESASDGHCQENSRQPDALRPGDGENRGAFIGPAHNRESSLRFNAHLHCGDPLNARTVHVPKGRPKTGNPPFTWEESAIDALTMPPHSLDRVPAWTIERTLYELEKYNGWGYLGKGNSPYLWAGTSEYHGGKYVADGVYSASAWDKQLGCVAVIKALAELDAGVAARIAGARQATAPPDVLEQGDETSRKARTARNIGAGTSATSAATKAGTEKPAHDGAASFAHSTVLPVAIALGLAVAVAAAVVIARKRKLIAAKWGG